jgi:hypothetical protein
VRCRRESKECYFSATRRKRKTDEDGALEDDSYVIRNGRKRLHAGDGPPPQLDVSLYSEVPLTPGGSVGRSQPLRRPTSGHTRSESTPTKRESLGIAEGEPNMPLENFEARNVMRREVYGPHDALELLYKAATE